jgi:hypothetical protein
MDHHLDIFELGQGGIGHGMQGLAGGIRHQVNVKFMIHSSVRNCPPGSGLR